MEAENQTRSRGLAGQGFFLLILEFALSIILVKVPGPGEDGGCWEVEMLAPAFFLYNSV